MPCHLLSIARRTLAVTCTVVMAVSTLLGANILCIGAEGHVSIESSFEDCCEGDASACAPAQSGSASGTAVRQAVAPEPAGSECIDFTLRSVVLAARQGAAGKALAPPLSATLHFVASQVSLAGDSAACACALPCRPRVPLVLTRLQGVILRC